MRRRQKGDNPKDPTIGQETPYTCEAENRRKIDADAGITVEESAMAQALETIEAKGATIRDAPKALQDVGLEGAIYQSEVSIEALAKATQGESAAIVGMRIPGTGSHALVVDAVAE